MRDCSPVTKLRREAKGPAVAGMVVLAAGSVTAAGWVDWGAVGQWLQPGAGVAATVVVGGALLALAASRQWRRTSSRMPRALSWWVVAAAIVLVAAVAWGATVWLVHQAAGATDAAAARVEAVKTGLGIGASVGGMFAVLLAVRRQQHQERSAADTTHDATERRVTELYTKATDQLGSDKPAVRLAGLYALERVAQNNPNQQQTVVNVLAAYLRMPFDPPGERPSDDEIPLPEDTTNNPETNAEMDRVRREYRERVQELEVRLAAQRILAKHLQPGLNPAAPIDTFWKNIDLDLTGAALVRWDLSNSQLKHATFQNARFTGPTRFSEARFVGTAVFRGAQFGGVAAFNGARFGDVAGFNGARFGDVAGFSEAWFGDVAGFSEAWFGDIVRFREARFIGTAKFHGAQFGDAVTFIGAQFSGDADLGRTQFRDDVVFSKTQFGGDVEFGGVQFGGDVEFSGIQFAKDVPPEFATLKHPSARADIEAGSESNG
jgi:uncharacterized protein YjbI with pentapeptide repeats